MKKIWYPTIIIVSVMVLAIFATIPASGTAGTPSSFSATVNIPPGSYYALFYKPGFGLKGMPIPGYHLPQVAIKAIKHVPRWIQPLLAKQFYNLMKGEVRVASNASVAVGDINGDGLPDVLVGSGDGTISVYINVGSSTIPRFKPYETITVAPGKSLNIAIGDMNGDSLPDIVIGFPNGTLLLYKNVGTPSSPSWIKDWSYFAGLNFGKNAAPAIFDADGNGVMDLVVGNATGIVAVAENMGTPANPIWSINYNYFPAWKENWWNGKGWHYEGVWVGNDSKPYVVSLGGHRYLFLASDDGMIHVFQQSGKAAYPTWENMGTLPNIHFSGPIWITVKDINGDRLPDLLIGTKKGDVYYIYNKGNLENYNFQVWKSDADKMLLANWFWGPAYYPDIEPLQSVETTTKYVDYYAHLILNVTYPYIDEVAYTIAVDRASNLKMLENNNGAYLYVLNAKSIYSMAKNLTYVQIVEKGNYTTLKYKTNNGWMELPEEVYYRYLVMFNRYIIAPWAWPSIYHGYFYRTFLPFNNTYNVTLYQRVSQAKTLYQAAYLVDYWLRVDIGAKWHTGPKPPGWYNIYMNLLNPKYGIWCGEFSIIYEVAARAMLVPTVVIVDIAEDHQFNNFWYNGTWHHVDASSGTSGVNGTWKKYFNPPRGLGGWYSKKGFSYPMEWEEDGMYDVPWRSPIPYSLPGELANVHVRVTDINGNPIDGARVEVWSHWTIEHHYDTAPYIAGFTFTDMNGIANINKLGLGRTHNFTVIVTSRIGSTMFKAQIEHGGNYYFNVTIPRALPKIAKPTHYLRPFISNSILSLKIKVLKGEQNPPCWIDILYRYFGYTYYYDLPAGGYHTNIYVMPLSEFEKFVKNEPFGVYFAAYNKTTFSITGGYLLNTHPGTETVIVISNRASVTTTITVKITAKVIPFSYLSYHKMRLAAPQSTTPLKSSVKQYTQTNSIVQNNVNEYPHIQLTEPKLSITFF